MNVRPPIVLRIWEGDYGAPSVDQYSLLLMVIVNIVICSGFLFIHLLLPLQTMFKVRKVNFTIENACFPYWQSIPSLQYEDKLLVDPWDLMVAVRRIVSFRFFKHNILM